jgi:hypothetical protein
MSRFASAIVRYRTRAASASSNGSTRRQAASDVILPSRHARSARPSEWSMFDSRKPGACAVIPDRSEAAIYHGFGTRREPSVSGLLSLSRRKHEFESRWARQTVFAPLLQAFATSRCRDLATPHRACHNELRGVVLLGNRMRFRTLVAMCAAASFSLSVLATAASADGAVFDSLDGVTSSAAFAGGY